LLDETATGVERVFREIGAAIISPMRGFNRLIRGDVRRKTNRVMNAYGWEKRPIEFLVGTSYRYLADRNDFLNGANCFSMDLGLMYGEPFHMEKTHAPLDYFDLRGTISFGGNQPVISSVNVSAIWWGRHVEPAPEHNMLVGVFQHLNYYDSDVLKRSKEQRVPFKIGEVASLGVGMMYKLPTLSQNIDMVVNMHGSAVILGGYLSDYFELIDRNYNYGSGFSAKIQTMLNIRRIGTFTMDIYHLNLYSWHEGNIERMYLWKSDTEERRESNKRYYLYTSSQGNKGWARLTIINPRFDFKLVDKLQFSLGVNFYTRATYYADVALEDNTYDSFEIKTGLTYWF
ncbi:MAG: hypothetical protein LBH34_06235, partial [Prevotellaceae bacterium]|nr:hypothetical protein [Prevotellaceae bacterium]